MKRTAFDHPKIGRLAKLLELPKYATIGIVESLWQFTAKHAPAGDVGKWTDEEIAESMGWEQEPGKLIKALVDARLLDPIAGARLSVHDWAQHCEDSIHLVLARRTEFFADGTKPTLTRLSKDERAKIEATYELAPTPRKRTANARRTHGKRTAKPEPSHAKPEPSHAKPEGSSEPAAPTAEPAVLEFPCVGDGPDTYELTQAKIDQYRESYPGVDVLSECRKARQWCLDNVVNRKTHGGMPRFLNRWLARVQDTGKPSPGKTVGRANHLEFLK